MRRAIRLFVLVGAAATLSFGPASARERSGYDGTECAFCAPNFVAADPTFISPVRHHQGRPWIGYSDGRFSRFDIEGIRLLTRMP